ncbi:hypothetical protein PoMZ_04174 [Pyricularia oryzae]|uniref:Uncharacterized protein n=1 Tax=Pyricularia oryzae TaxID=318829 RepID=A0A4P7N9M0_PYROR|nr:hypothetical protein PoMZ_04174 [Pyricularia oryzae]
MGSSHSSHRHVRSRQPRVNHSWPEEYDPEDYHLKAVMAIPGGKESLTVWDVADTTPLGRLHTPPMMKIWNQASYAEERAEDEAREVERDSEQAEYEAREAEYERERAEYEAFEAEQKAIYEAEFRNFYRAYQTFYEAYYDAFKAFKAVADFEGSDDWEATVDQRMLPFVGSLVPRANEGTKPRRVRPIRLSTTSTYSAISFERSALSQGQVIMSWNDKFRYTGRGINKFGNHWDSRDYGTGGNPYHYSNKNGDCPNGQKYYKDLRGDERDNDNNTNTVRGGGRTTNYADSTNNDGSTHNQVLGGSDGSIYGHGWASEHCYRYVSSSDGCSDQACDGSSESHRSLNLSDTSLHHSSSDSSEAPTGHVEVLRESMDEYGQDVTDDQGHEGIDSPVYEHFDGGGFDHGYDEDGGDDDNDASDDYGDHDEDGDDDDQDDYYEYYVDDDDDDYYSE